MSQEDFRTLDKDENVFIDEYLLQNTDYGTVEITADHVQEMLEEAQDPDMYGKTPEEVREILKKFLGEEVLSMLLEGTLDFIQVVY